MVQNDRFFGYSHNKATLSSELFFSFLLVFSEITNLKGGLKLNP